MVITEGREEVNRCNTGVSDGGITKKRNNDEEESP